MMLRWPGTELQATVSWRDYIKQTHAAAVSVPVDESQGPAVT